jgi:uncharacterized membrane protein YfcA
MLEGSMNTRVRVFISKLWRPAMKFLATGIIAAGLLVGVFVGIVGTGGAFIIPALVYVFKLSQLKAQGTALLIAASPIWIFPFVPYWRARQYDFRIAVLLGIGVAVGGYFGAILAQHLPPEYLRKAFAFMLMALAIRMFLQR